MKNFENVMDYMAGVWTLVKFVVVVVVWFVATSLLGYGALYAVCMSDYGHAPTEWQASMSFCFGVIVEMIVGMVGWMVYDIITTKAKERREKRAKESKERMERELTLKWDELCMKYAHPGTVEFDKKYSFDRDRYKVLEYLQKNKMRYTILENGNILTECKNAKDAWHFSGAYGIYWRTLEKDDMFWFEYK